jgi:hypothetical protein
MQRLLLLSMCLCAACAQPAPAPEDLDGLARFFFNRWTPPEDVAISDSELADGVVKLHAALEGKIDEPLKGLLADLTQEELDGVGLSDRDPKKPQGIYMADIVHCTLDQIEEILQNDDQLSLYPEAYASYARERDADPPPYHPTWTTTYTSSENALITNQFTARVKTGLRKVPDLGAQQSPFGRALVLRVVLPEPATFESDGSEFTDDFQIETFHERAPGELVHFYGMWRYMRLGILGDSNDGLFIDQTLNGMVDWDKKTDALCAN